MIMPVARGEIFVKTVVGAFVKLCSPGVRKLKLHKTAAENNALRDD